jgi:beta-phosphoglucomutase-like phosphatase (HAD superfamily)
VRRILYQFWALHDKTQRSEECLIVEDSPVGIQSAKATGAKVWELKKSSHLTLDNYNQQLGIL